MSAYAPCTFEESLCALCLVDCNRRSYGLFPFRVPHVIFKEFAEIGGKTAKRRKLVDALAEPRRFVGFVPREADLLRKNGKLRLDLADIRGTVLGARELVEQDAAEQKLRIEAADLILDEVRHLVNPLDAVSVRRAYDDDLIRGRQGVENRNVDVGRIVNQADIVLVVDNLQSVPQNIVLPGIRVGKNREIRFHQAHIGGNQVDVRVTEVDFLPLAAPALDKPFGGVTGRLDAVMHIGSVQQKIRQRRLLRIGAEEQTGVALLVVVDDRHAPPEEIRESKGSVGDDGGLPHASFEVNQTDCFHE